MAQNVNYSYKYNRILEQKTNLVFLEGVQCYLIPVYAFGEMKSIFLM